MGTAAVAAGVTAHVVEPADGRPCRWLVPAALAHDLAEADALPTHARKYAVPCQGGHVVGAIALPGLNGLLHARPDPEERLLQPVPPSLGVGSVGVRRAE